MGVGVGHLLWLCVRARARPHLHLLLEEEVARELLLLQNVGMELQLRHVRPRRLEQKVVLLRPPVRLPHSSSSASPLPTYHPRKPSL